MPAPAAAVLATVFAFVPAAGAAPLPLVATVPLVAGVPRVGAAPRLAGVLVTLTAGAADLALEMLAAVGLVSLSATSAESVCFLTGGAGSAELRARASEAAVGAKSPEAGVLGRGAEAGVFGRGVCEGVFGRATDGVFERAGVMGARIDALEDGRGAADLMFFKLTAVRRGCEGVDADDEMGGAPWNDVGGDLAGVRVAFAPVAVDGRPEVGLSFEGVVGTRVPAVDGRALCGFVGAGAVGGGDTAGAGSSGAGGSGAGSIGLCGGDAAALRKSEGSALGDASGVGNAGRSDATSRGGGDVASTLGSGSFSFSFSAAFGRGGHSRFSFTSSFAASPATFESELDVRAGAEPIDCRFVCCSNRPMRFATL